MMLFRNAQESDLFAISQLAESSGVGITTLPKDAELLKSRLIQSIRSFEKSVSSPKNEYYLFVLEDPIQHKIVGTSAIEAATGYSTPFYSYKLSKKTAICQSLNIRTTYEVLTLVNDNQGYSELCTLYLDPVFRIQGNGSLLSRARFLFMANYPERFAPVVIAELRGISNEEGQSPFWNHVGAHFFQIPFAEADRLTLSTDKQFIADLMPRNLLYVNLLAPEAQAVIGKPHESSVKAMNLLLHEGFSYNNYVDIFDAGPTLEAKRNDIITITYSKLAKITSISHEIGNKKYLLANTQLNFRATLNKAIYNEQQESCVLDLETAELLQLKCGDYIRLKACHESSSKQ